MQNLSKTPFPIVFAIDKNYISHFATALFSLLVNNKDINLKIYVLTTDDLSNYDNKIRQISNSFNVSLEILVLDDNFFMDFFVSNHITKATYFRILIPSLINHDRCLYLDSDLIVLSSIKELIEFDLKDYYVGAVKDIYPAPKLLYKLGFHSKSKYFNAGLLLINIKKWVACNIQPKTINIIKNKDFALTFHDQCALNAVINGKWIELHKKYNFMLQPKSHYKNEKSISPLIVHFITNSKPWHFKNNHPYKNKYWYFRNKTKFKFIFGKYFGDDFEIIEYLSWKTPDFIKKMIRPLKRFIINKFK